MLLEFALSIIYGLYCVKTAADFDVFAGKSSRDGDGIELFDGWL